MKIWKIIGVILIFVLLASFVSAAVVKSVVVIAKPQIKVVKIIKPIVKPVYEPEFKPFTGGLIITPKYYLDSVNKAPSIVDVVVDPVEPHVDDDFTITVEAIDNEGIDTLRLKKGSVLLGSEDCLGATICEKTFTVTESVADDYIYKAFADDTDVNHDIEFIYVTVIECPDTDNDGVCDDEEDSDCVGENASNVPSDTDCASYSFNSTTGCHDESYEAYGYVVNTTDCDYLDDVCVDYDDVDNICNGTGGMIYGTCTDFTNDDGTTVCDADVGDIYSCIDGTDPGDDVYDSMTRQYCGIDTGSCDGTVEEYGGWSVYDDCTMLEICIEGQDACVNASLDPPSISGVSITPISPYTDDVLTCTPHDWNSSVGDPEAYYFVWKDNLVDIPGEVSNTLDCGAVVGCDKNDMITCEATPHDSVGNGTPKSSDMMIMNSLPEVTTYLTPNPAYFDDDLTCVCDITDADGDLASCEYYEFWFQLINGSWFRLQNGTSDTLPFTVVFKDDNYKCFARANDGEDVTSLIESPVLTIGNYGPEAQLVKWISYEGNYTDGTDPFELSVYYNDEGFVQVTADDPETAIIPTYTCLNQDTYETTDCTFNFTALSDTAPVECDSHPQSGCYNVLDDQGQFEIIVEMTDVDGVKENVSVFIEVNLLYFPPEISVADEYNVTEGSPVFCPCVATDPDGGTTNTYCGDPINGSGLDYWIPFHADIGANVITCNATDDEGQVSETSFTVNVNEGIYTTDLHSQIENSSGIVIDLWDTFKVINSTETKSLLGSEDLWAYTVGNAFCTSVFCGNSGGSDWNNNITDYFDNFQNEITESKRVYIYGSNWIDYMDNEGYGDSNEEVTIVLLNITQI